MRRVMLLGALFLAGCVETHAVRDARLEIYTRIDTLCVLTAATGQILLLNKQSCATTRVGDSVKSIEWQLPHDRAR